MDNVVAVLTAGGIVAYPTEAVYGLGCDPLNEQAVKKILQLKQRSIDKGLILIAANYEQLKPFIKPLPPEQMQKILHTWPGAVTWVFPASEKTPFWITGEHDTVAIRVPDHDLARAICSAYGSPIVSTSANLSNQPPLKTAVEVRKCFGANVDLIVPGSIGHYLTPSKIYDAMTGAALRI